MKKRSIEITISLLLFGIAVFESVKVLKISIYLISYIIIGYKVIIGSIRDIVKDKKIDEEFLMSIASIGAFIIGEYPEAIAVMLFFEIGEIFEKYAEEKSKKSIKSLMKLKPDYANVKKADRIVKTFPDDVEIGNIIVVTPGERVPLDGIIVRGESLVDTSSITGETVPKRLSVNEKIYSGSINKNSMLEIKVTKRYKESTVNKILNLVQNATEKKTQTEKFITKFAKLYTPIVIILAILVLIIPTAFLKQNFTKWAYRALTFLVISCPCALVISVPLSFFGGIGGASKQGILINGSNYLELLSKIDTVVLDKTGTLTKGNFKVQSVEPIERREEFLRLAAHVEFYSNHPIANSIKEAYGRYLDASKISNFQEISGRGVIAVFEGKEIYIGNSKFMSYIGTKIEDDENLGTQIYIAINRKVEGRIVIADEIKTDSNNLVKNLKECGIKQTIMLTGDKKEVGEIVKEKLGIDKIYTELLPTDKVRVLETILEGKKGTVAFVGDGINDSPAIARADVGIAMGGCGTDAAIDVADAVIMTDEPSKICTAIKIAKQTMKIAKENIGFAIGIKVVVLLLSFFGIATMWEAVFADVGVTIIATLNALRTLK